MYMCVRAEAGSRLDGYSGNEAMLRCKTWRKEGGEERERRAEERRRLDIRVCRVEVRYNRDCM